MCPVPSEDECAHRLPMTGRDKVNNQRRFPLSLTCTPHTVNPRKMLHGLQAERELALPLWSLLWRLPTPPDRFGASVLHPPMVFTLFVGPELPQVCYLYAGVSPSWACCHTGLGAGFPYIFAVRETQGGLTSCAWSERGWGGVGPDAGAAAAESGLLWPSDGSRCLWSCPGRGGCGPSLPETSECWTEMCTLLNVQRKRERNSKRIRSRGDTETVPLWSPHPPRPTTEKLRIYLVQATMQNSSWIYMSESTCLGNSCHLLCVSQFSGFVIKIS